MRNGSDTAWAVQRARELGFDLCGVVRADKFPELGRIEEWLSRGHAGEMQYLHDPQRSDPQSVMPGVRSLIVCALNYNSDPPRSIEMSNKRDAREPRGWISRYAWGQDYHEVLRQKLELLVADMRRHFPEDFALRVYTDTGPLQERVLAKYAGLGWLGKNTLLLNASLGSWFFLGAILTTLDLQPTLSLASPPPPDLCGTCRKCIDACPTGAFPQPYVMDARLCISYLTIELRGSIPEPLREKMGWHVFGCDICQDVCPWNRRAPVTKAEEFQPRPFSRATEADAPVSVPQGEERAQEDSLFFPRLEWLAAMDEEEFREVFRRSAIKRAKWRGLVRNACIALGNSRLQPGTAGHTRICSLLHRLESSSEPLIAESARWALSRIQ